MLKGSCACGRIRYELHGALAGPVGYCHCWQCRKHSGSSFGTTAAIKSAGFHIVSGEELLADWQSSPGIHRFFASCCGSPIFKRRDAFAPLLGLRLGTLDSDPDRRVEEHIFTSSKAPWVEICDDLPRKDGGVPFGRRE